MPSFLLLFGLLGCGSHTPTAPTAAPPAPAVVQAPAPPLPPPPPAFETWIISGQSNAVGCAQGSGPAPSERVLMPSGGSWVPARDPLPFMDAFDGCQVGPWVSTAQAVSASLDHPIRLTGYGHIGTELAAWSPGQAAWGWLSQHIQAEGQGASWFLWFQGEAEAYDYNHLGAGYADRLVSLLARVRAASGNPQLRAVVVGLADAPSTGAMVTGYAAIREAQRQAVAADPSAVYVSAEGLPLQRDHSPHLTAEGYGMLAQRIAQAMQAPPAPVLKMVR